jgi:hypothetical protein
LGTEVKAAPIAELSVLGEMREWLNRAASKAVVPLVGTEGSNPSLSEQGEGF